MNVRCGSGRHERRTVFLGKRSGRNWTRGQWKTVTGRRKTCIPQSLCTRETRVGENDDFPAARRVRCGEKNGFCRNPKRISRLRSRGCSLFDVRETRETTADRLSADQPQNELVSEIDASRVPLSRPSFFPRVVVIVTVVVVTAEQNVKRPFFFFSFPILPTHATATLSGARRRVRIHAVRRRVRLTAFLFGSLFIKLGVTKGN